MSELATLLQIDIVDSTKLGEELGDAAMSELWRAHDRRARDLLIAFRGREIDKSDGFLLLFADRNDAFRFALAYRSAIKELDLRLRARTGLHCGHVIVRRNAPADVARGAKPVEIDGSAKVLAARVMSIAAADQILATADAATGVDLAGHQVVSHGHWRVKGFSDPVSICQVGRAGESFAPPADGEKAYRVVAQDGETWLPVAHIRNTLPHERDKFVGRSATLRHLARELASGVRLLSILGPGGVGKTRLAVHFARAWMGEFPGGVWFCDLSHADTLDGLHSAVAQGLDLALGQSDPAVQLSNAIRGRGACLIILDNFEQLVGAASETVGHWMDRAPRAQFLVTTREPLRIPGEHSHVLESLVHGDAVALLIARAGAARQDFDAGAENRAAVERLAELLEGLPLAIELVAPRLGVMSALTLVARMNDRFRLLSSSTGRSRRHATLRATLDWSWDLLSGRDRSALAQLSVFAGGFSLGSAESVLDLSWYAADGSVADAVQSLVEKSLLRHLGNERYAQLESIREYAGERLQSGTGYPDSSLARKVEAEARHGAHFASRSFRSATPEDLLEIDNLVAACRRAIGRGDGEVIAGACLGAWDVLRFRGPYRSAAELVQLALASPTLSERGRLTLTFLSGRTRFLCGDVVSARAEIEAAVATAERLGEHDQRCRFLASLAELNFCEGRTSEAMAQYRQVLEAGERTTNLQFQCAALNGLGTCFDNLGDLASARSVYEHALVVSRKAGDLRWQGGASGNLAQLLHRLGLHGEAGLLYESTVAIARSLGDRAWEASALCNWGLLSHARGEDRPALQQLEAALLITREIGHRRVEAVVLCNLGIVNEALGRSDAAREHYSAALSIARYRKDLRCEGQFLGYLGLLEARSGHRTAAETAFERGEALLRETKDPVSLAILLCAAAQAAHLAADRDRATASLDEAMAIAGRTGMESTSELGLALAEATTLLSTPAVIAQVSPALEAAASSSS
ncbi:MAG TPA: tetratricopeptide repeat protein [Caldimonas sp.]|jgi:predicted ATPase/class 3 adenylate cyclase|nr:tetratricopeptide repeat protein [Caldimonas sp.]HEX2540428.1 tetratricopeptide repeat protein [Caldimonas sp.]